ncbi:ankyrin repeat domain-containing protein [Campylobacter sp. JMF_04 NA10]|uniref:ankyrin repeat domain-containing protein n=1 Tax=Campylobacter sp. JMF_04 NA10 TaxID=2983824 RepID=UPI0022E9E659|nr:ankyrin repeat domain-containing protein [Campylobacter sp. JMF_04 NA10]MDA3076987.1 ankyrin repeat domain-containing protein [Campylobacter sp. JMF_04 NA10]
MKKLLLVIFGCISINLAIAETNLATHFLLEPYNEEYKKIVNAYKNTDLKLFDKLIKEEAKLKNVDFETYKQGSILFLEIGLAVQSNDFYKFNKFAQNNKKTLNQVFICNEDNEKFIFKVLDLILIYGNIDEKTFKIIEILVQNGAELNYYFLDKSFDKYTPLGLAIANPKISNEYKFKLVDLFVKHGADVNLQTDKTANPLQDAIFDENIEIFEYLLKHKIDTTNKLWRGLSLLSPNMVAHKNGDDLTEYITMQKTQDEFSNKIINLPYYETQNKKMVEFLEIFLRYTDLSDQKDTLTYFVRDLVFANNIEAVKMLLDFDTPQHEQVKFFVSEYAKFFDRKEILDLLKK